CICGLSQPRQHQIPVQRNAGSIDTKVDEEYGGVRRQFRYALQHLLKIEIIEPFEGYPVRKGFRRAVELLCPEPLQRRSTNDPCDMRCVGENPQNTFNPLF